MKTIAEHWESFAAEVVPSDAGPAQRHGSRLAFYAGAAALYALFMRVESADVSDAQGILMLEALRLELDAFGQAADRPPALAEGAFAAELDRLVARGSYTVAQAATAREFVAGLAARANRGELTRQQAEAEIAQLIARLNEGRA